MTLKEAKDKIAQKYNYVTLSTMELLMKSDEAAELYARSKWDEAIEEAATLACVDNIGTDGEAYILNHKPKFKP